MGRLFDCLWLPLALYFSLRSSFGPVEHKITAMDVLQMIFGVIVIVLMLGLGAAMSMKEFKEALRMWKAPLVAVLCQFILMPLISFGLALALGVTKLQGLSMLVVGCSPGGSTSNLFAYYSRADLPLSILATSLSTLLSVGMMPLCLYIYSSPFTDDNVSIPLTSLITPLSLAPGCMHYTTFFFFFLVESYCRYVFIYGTGALVLRSFSLS